MGYIKVNKSGVKKFSQDITYNSLLQQAKVVFNRVNKRIRNIENNNQIISPAYNALVRKRGDAPRFGQSWTIKDLESLKKEYSQALAFDNMETSTVQGAKNFTNNLKNQLHMTDLNDEGIKLVFETLGRVHETMPDTIFGNILDYKEYLDTVIEQKENIDFNKFTDYEDMLNELTQNTINELNDKITDSLNMASDILSGSDFNRLF